VKFFGFGNTGKEAKPKKLALFVGLDEYFGEIKNGWTDVESLYHMEVLLVS